MQTRSSSWPSQPFTSTSRGSSISSSTPPRKTRTILEIYSEANLASTQPTISSFEDELLTSLPDDPVNVDQAINSPESSLWLSAMQAEFESLLANTTWILVDPPPNRRLISCKWILRRKYNAQGEVARFKARLVARGYTQVPGEDFHDTYSPVLSIISFRILVALAANFGWPIHQMDVKTAFLHGDLNEEIYMHQPPHFLGPHHPHKVCRLHKSQFGLKQSPRQWYIKFTSVLMSLRYTQLHSEPNIYIRNNHNSILIIGLYVDDLIIVCDQLPNLIKAKQ